MNVNATPKGTRMMWKPSVNAICSRAGNSCDGSAALASTQRCSPMAPITHSSLPPAGQHAVAGWCRERGVPGHDRLAAPEEPEGCGWALPTVGASCLYGHMSMGLPMEAHPLLRALSSIDAVLDTVAEIDPGFLPSRDKERALLGV